MRGHRDELQSSGNRFIFWRNWLLGVSMLSTLMGVVIALFPNSFIFDLHTSAIAETYFQGAMSENAADMRTFLFAPLGGTIAGYFLLQTFIVWIPFSRRQPWAWHAVLWSMLLWFVIDSGLSIYHGAWFNVWMINIWTLLLTGVSLTMTHNYFAAAPRVAVDPAEM